MQSARKQKEHRQRKRDERYGVKPNRVPHERYVFFDLEKFHDLNPVFLLFGRNVRAPELRLCRRVARLVGGERLDDRLLVGARVDRLDLDAWIVLFEFAGHAVDELGDRTADRDWVVERHLG